MADKIILSIPEELKQKLEERIKNTNFKSAEDYILYILKQLLSEENAYSPLKNSYTEEEEVSIKGSEFFSEEKSEENLQSYTNEDEEALKKNLEDMGYL